MSMLQKKDRDNLTITITKTLKEKGSFGDKDDSTKETKQRKP